MVLRAILAAAWLVVFVFITQTYMEPLITGRSLPIIVAGCLAWGAVMCATAIFVFNLKLKFWE